MSVLLIEVILIGNLENIKRHKEENKNSQIPAPANILVYFLFQVILLDTCMDIT